MALDLLKEVIKLNRVVGTESSQGIIENDIIVPDTKPDVLKILIIDGEIGETHAEIHQDKMVVSGTLRIKILYIADNQEGTIKSIEAENPFSHPITLQNSNPELKCKAKCEVEHLEYEILHGRKINVKSIVTINGILSKEVEHEVVCGSKESENVEIAKENIKLNAYVGEANAQQTISEALEVPSGKPAIREILRNDLKISALDCKMTEGKIIAKGEANVSTLYIGDDEELGIQYMEHEIPFSQVLELDGVDENSVCRLDCQVGDYTFEPGEDSDGELRVLNGTIQLELLTSGYNPSSMEILSDAYSTRSKLVVEKEPVTVDETVGEHKGQIILKDTLTLNDENPEIAEVFSILCKPVLSEAKLYEDKVVLEGVVNSNVLYLAQKNEQPISCWIQEIPFKHGIDLKGIRQGMNCEPEIGVEHCSYSMISSTEVEIRLVLVVSLRVNHQGTRNLIVNMEELPLEESRGVSQPSIVIYFVKTGDTLWKIAKNYLIPIAYLESMNNLNVHSPLAPGQQIIIPKKG